MAESASGPRSALAGLAKSGRHGKPDGAPGVRARLLWPLSLALVMPKPGAAAECLTRLASVYGAALARVPPRRAVRGDGLDLAWAGPDRYLASTAADLDIEAKLQAICGDSAAVIDQSDGRFVLRLTGPRLRDTLAKGVAIDLHPRAFVVGETALAQLAHMHVQLMLLDDAPTFDLVGPRTAAGDVWDWLVASAAAFGLEMETFS